ncbi:MAG TPA: hypothetical protein VFD58_36630 [Blastocatellia bacterium]|nr:hypothetical protein [Blastocatellia bacterium]
MKYCHSCQQEKPTSEFARNNSRPDGLQTACKVCQNKWGKQRYQKTKHLFRERNRQLKIRNQKAVAEYLKDKACVDCGVTNPVVLTFDHFRDKKYTVSQMVLGSHGLDTIFAEIKKCRIRCFNCHMISEAKKRGDLKWKALAQAA